jgi:hypothetical protein
MYSHMHRDALVSARFYSKLSKLGALELLAGSLSGGMMLAAPRTAYLHIAPSEGFYFCKLSKQVSAGTLFLRL